MPEGLSRMAAGARAEGFFTDAGAGPNCDSVKSPTRGHGGRRPDAPWRKQSAVLSGLMRNFSRMTVRVPGLVAVSRWERVLVE